MSDGEYPPLPAREDGWPYAIRYAWCATRDLPLPLVGRRKVGPGQGPHWSAEDDAVMRAEYPTARANGTISQLAERLHRTPIAIMTRARKLGVARQRSA